MADIQPSAEGSTGDPGAGHDAPGQQRPRQTPRRHTPQAGLILRRRTSIPNRRPPDDAISPSRRALLDWPMWLGLIERKRRVLQRQLSLHGGTNGAPATFAVAGVPIDLLSQATRSNFQLDRIVVSDHEVADALAPGAAGRKFRSRTAQRIRNHIAILYSIENGVRIGQPLKCSIILRWYTSISSGLSMTSLGVERMARLDQVARRINSPQLRLQPAIQEIVRGHMEFLTDPLFPSFNGILSRLLLRYHLGRCGLPFVVFGETPHPSNSSVPSEASITLQLLNAIDRTYDLLLG